MEVEFIMIRNILLVVHIIVCVSLILIVILQSGRSAGISGEIAGGAETFFGKNKARTLNGMLGRWTTYAAIIFVMVFFSIRKIQKNAKKGCDGKCAGCRVTNCPSKEDK